MSSSIIVKNAYDSFPEPLLYHLEIAYFVQQLKSKNITFAKIQNRQSRKFSFIGGAVRRDYLAYLFN